MPESTLSHGTACFDVIRIPDPNGVQITALGGRKCKQAERLTDVPKVKMLWSVQHSA